MNNEYIIAAINRASFANLLFLSTRKCLWFSALYDRIERLLRYRNKSQFTARNMQTRIWYFSVGTFYGSFARHPVSFCLFQIVTVLFHLIAALLYRVIREKAGAHDTHLLL